MAGVPILAAVGAPSSLAVDLAQQFDMTLIGFMRDGRCNIYTAAWRVCVDKAALVAGAIVPCLSLLTMSEANGSHEPS